MSADTEPMPAATPAEEVDLAAGAKKPRRRGKASQQPGQPGQPGHASTMRPEPVPAAAAEPGQAGTDQPPKLPRFELIEGIKGMRPGVYWLGLVRDKQTGQEVPATPAWICSPLRIVANTRGEDGSDWGRLLEWRDRDRRLHRWAMPCELLAGSGEELRAALLRDGVEITNHPTDRRRLLDYITGSKPGVTACAVSRTGWHGCIFVLPERTFGDDPARPVHYQATRAEGIGLGTAGTLEDWRAQVSVPCVGNSRLVLAVAAGFAASCLGLVGAEGGGVHLRGPSSCGKSTCLRVAASLWGPPRYVRTWRATDNALEGIAALHSDLLLCLDEMGELPAKSAGATAYMLANGSGKGRAYRDGSTRQAARWRVLYLSTGEIGLADLIAEGGGRARAGQEVRVVDVPADAAAGLGLFETVPADSTGAEFADALATAAAMHHGHAGPAFVAQLVKHHGQARSWLQQRQEAIAATLVQAHAAGQVQRVAQRVALIGAAGELATHWGLTGWPPGEAERGVAACFRAWLDARGTIASAEPAAMVKQVRRFLEAHGDSRFTPWDEDRDDRPTINRVGFRKQASGSFEYFVLAESFRSEVCVGFDHRAVARTLADGGALMLDSDGGTTRAERLPGLPKVRCYRILPAIWDMAV